MISLRKRLGGIGNFPYRPIGVFMSGTRWFLSDYRYLSISVKIEHSDIEAPVGSFTGYILAVAIRPLIAPRVSSLWTLPFRWLHFVALITSFSSFSLNCDIVQTDEECEYPDPGYPGPAHLAGAIWRSFILNGVSRLEHLASKFYYWLISLRF